MFNKFIKLSKNTLRALVMIAFLSNNQAIFEVLEKYQPGVLKKIDFHSKNFTKITSRKATESIDKLLNKETNEYRELSIKKLSKLPIASSLFLSEKKLRENKQVSSKSKLFKSDFINIKKLNF